MCITDTNHLYDPEEQWFCPQCGKHVCICRDYDSNDYEPDYDICDKYYDGR